MPETPPNTRAPKLPLIGLITLVVAVIMLLAYSAKSLREVSQLTEKNIPPSRLAEPPPIEEPNFSGNSERAPEVQTTFTPAGQADNSSECPPSPPAPSKPSRDDMQYAEPVFGNPLVVVLPGKNASLGEISVEKYDSEGNATGEPLPQHTQVQIPDPNNPGEKIYFKVP